MGDGPGGIAFGADRVWVANGQDGTISAINPQTNQVGTLRLGSSRPPWPWWPSNAQSGWRWLRDVSSPKVANPVSPCFGYKAL